MEKKNTGLKIIFILLAIIGFVGFVFSTLLFCSCVESLSSEDAAETVVSALLIFPLYIIASFIPVLGGIILLPSSIAMRKKEEVKSKFSLTMLIIASIYIAVPVLLFVLLIIIF